MRRNVRRRFLEILDRNWPKGPNGRRTLSQERIGELLVAGSDLPAIQQGQISDIENSEDAKNIGPNFLVALSHYTGESINELLGETAPQPRSKPVEDAHPLLVEALYAAIAFIGTVQPDPSEPPKYAFGGLLNVRYHALREAVHAAQGRAHIETEIATSAATAIDKIRRATEAFTVATERTERAARVADKTIGQLIRKVS